jgi:hypothetical protein
LGFLATATKFQSAGATDLFTNKTSFLQFNNWSTNTKNHYPWQNESDIDITSNDQEIKLTPNLGGKNGSLWNTQPITMDRDFSISANYFFGVDGGADGIYFYLRPLEKWNNYGTLNGATRADQGAGSGHIEVFFDTWPNGNEIADDHITIQASNSGNTWTNYSGNGDNFKDANGNLLTNVENGEWHPLTIKWSDADNYLRIYYGLNAERLITEKNITDTQMNINELSWGWYGITGGASNYQSVKQVTYHIGPKITSQPSNVSTSHGSSVTFSTTFTSSESSQTKYWKYSTDNGSTWTSTGESSNSYTFTATRSMDNRLYRYFVESTGVGLTSSRTSNNATLRVSPPYANSETDTAMFFEGTNFLTSSEEAVFDNISGTTFTIEAWVKPSNISDTNPEIIAAKDNQYAIYLLNGKFGYYYITTNGSLGQDVNAVSAKSGEWQHILFARNGATLRFFVNGQEIYTGSNVPGLEPLKSGAANFTIGGLTGGYQLFQGEIDQVRVSSADRSGFVSTDMNVYQTGDAELIAHYDFNEGDSSTVYNRLTGSKRNTDLSLNSGINQWKPIANIYTSLAYTVVGFTRSYLTGRGGWKIPSGISKVSSLVVAGGGAGGSRAGGGGGAGGFVYDGALAVSAGTYETITVGVGGFGKANYQGANGTNSSLGIKRIVIGGGGGGAANSIGRRSGANGGSGGGTPDSTATYGTSTQSSTYSYGFGNSGASGTSSGNWPGGGGGGAGGAGASGSTTSAGGLGKISSITGADMCFAAGGGGGIYQSPGTGTRDNGGGCTGYVGKPGGSGSSGLTKGLNALANTGSGGGGSGWVNNADGSDLAGGDGGSGIVVIRYISARAPAFTSPATVDTTTAGNPYSFVITETATAPLVRSFVWQYSTETGTANSWSNVQSSTSETYTVTSPETSTSGIRYQYRVIVSDTDTAGLSITETSTIFYLVVNPRILITGLGSISSSYGETATATFAISGGTGTRTTVVTPNNRSNISWSSVSGSSATLNLGSSLTYGSYEESITVTDSVSATSTYIVGINRTKAAGLTITFNTPAALTYSENGYPSYSNSVTVSTLVNGDTVTAVTPATYSYKYTYIPTTCETGGVCALGDTGPGGGIVFYVNGNDYVEAAPKNWFADIGYDNTPVKYCSVANGDEMTNQTPLSNQVDETWGGGLANFNAFKPYCATGAVGLVKDYSTLKDKSWYIPNKTELTGLMTYLTSNGRRADLFDYPILDPLFWTSNATWDSGYNWLLKQPYFNGSFINAYFNNTGVAYNNQGGKVIPIRKFTALGSITVDASGLDNAGTYTVTPTLLNLASPATLDNYSFVTYVGNSLVINKKQPSGIKLPTNGVPGTALVISALGGSGDGKESVTVTSGGCTLSGKELSRSTAGTCVVRLVKKESQNYLTETATATVSFFVFTFSQPTNNVGGGGEIGINGSNNVSTNASAAPVVTNYVNTTLGSGRSGSVGNTLTFTGKNFILGSTVEFQSASGVIVVAAQNVNTTNPDANTLTVTVPAGAVSGPLAVTNNVGARRTFPFTLL